MSRATPHRIDTASKPRPLARRQTPRRVRPAKPAPVVPLKQLADQRDDFDPESWLKLHASELITRLQTWATELEARESELDSRQAEQDRRERQFRIQRAVVEDPGGAPVPARNNPG